uniref:Uncharacterized protein n=1 Tax=Stegastes partitus TaxID=144197 RepID=A0A3B5A8N8_9TELE
MEGQSRFSHRYLVLQVWCGLLTVSVVLMAAFLATIKPKSAQDKVSTLKPDAVSPAGAARGLEGASPSFIQLSKSLDGQSWEVEAHSCSSCSLELRNNTIYFLNNSLYFIYAQVTFRKTHQSKVVVMKRNAVFGKTMKKLIVGTFPNTTEGSVWMAKIVRLTQEDSVSLDISGEILNEDTVWGAYQLR